MAKKAFKASNKNMPTPDDLSGHFLMFRDVPENHAFGGLNGSLMLTIEDEKLSNYVFALVMNENWHQSFHKYMKSEGLNISEQFHFVRMADAGKDEFEPVESNVINFLTHSSNSFLADKSVVFGNFALYVCETSEEARDIAQYVGPEDDILVLYSQIFMPRDELEQLIKSGNVLLREAKPDIVFNKSAYMRERLSFPELFEAQNGNPPIFTP